MISLHPFRVRRAWVIDALALRVDRADLLELTLGSLKLYPQHYWHRQI